MTGRTTRVVAIGGRRASTIRLATRGLLAIGALLLISSAGAHDARALDVLFPAYANPCCGGGPAMWNALIATAATPGARTIGNPGITATQNPSGQTTWSAADYAAVFDVLVTFEHTGAEYRTGYAPPAYLAAKPAKGFAHLIHSDAPFDPALLALATSRKAGLVFVSDDVLPNPYDVLPSYWTAFVAAITAFDAAPVPIASPLARIALGVATLALGTWASRARRSPFRSPSDRLRRR